MEEKKMEVGDREKVNGWKKIKWKTVTKWIKCVNQILEKIH